MPPEPRHFDICGSLPGPGVTILEASAGTGKTFTIAALVARLVAEGAVHLSEILAVTFTRMATGELRDRVRERLVTAERGLSRVLDAGEEPPGDDLVLGLLAAGSQEVVALRRRRLADALASFDSATITTTHGFCHMVLAALGVWGEVASGATLLEDPTDLVEEVVDDLFVRHVLRSGSAPFRRRQALESVLAAVRTPTRHSSRARTHATLRLAGSDVVWAPPLVRKSGAACSTPTSSLTTTSWSAWRTLSKTANGGQSPANGSANGTGSC